MNQTTTQNNAGSATDLLLALQQVMSWIDNWSPSFTEDPEWPADRDAARAAIALARATPQHSVTEQASIGDDSKFQEFIAALVNNEYTNYMDFMASFISYLDARSQPLASTAATQPDQTSEREAFEAWAKSQGNRRGRKGDGYSTEYTQRAWLAWQARAALAIPASTATGEQESEQADEVRPYTEAVAREAWGIVCNSRRGLTDAASAAIRDALLNPLWHASSPASTASNGEKA